jgi:hypothetical protein
MSNNWNCSTDTVAQQRAHSNILMQDEQISGVVDWDGFAAGDCTFDIATFPGLLLRSQYGGRESLLQCGC